MHNCTTEEIKGKLDILFFTVMSSEEERRVFEICKGNNFFPANTVCKETEFLIIGLSFLLTHWSILIGWEYSYFHSFLYNFK